MSSMLEQAIVDAKALREAALKNAEQAIIEKYGEKTIQHPKKEWNDEKEKEYLEDLKGFYK